ncbi:MAG: M48 family metallopeptidase [Acidaminococcus sp.]|jgi:hypothetical protein|nr:M48 family metallopeptidase [Acidaminococcus sp.]MCI2115331.1 M48 family metallopeptidase [Acidaminococcus sp.]MCI2117408.1 M48 family metallopeptidase [Acidaminococcus sp.]
MVKKFKFKQRAVALAAAVMLTLGGAAAPATVHAFDWGDAIGAMIGVTAEYSMLNDQVNYLDGKGRHEFLQSMKDKEGVSDDYAANAMLDRVMGRLTTVIGKEDPKLAEKPYNYFVNNNENFNAYCTLGHNLSVNIGLFKMLDYNEDEVAFVVGHELGHGQKNDPANGVKKTFPLALLAAVAGSQGNMLEAVGANVLANMGSAKMITLPMEKRADVLGFDYASKAGYNPGAGAALWQRVIEKMGTRKQSFLGSVFNPSDHPGNEARRDRYAKRMYEFSGDHVAVDKESGAVVVNKKTIGQPAATSSMSARERSYTVAGRLAKVYHDQPETVLSASSDGSDLYFGGTRIMRFTAGDNEAAWVQNLNAAVKPEDDKLLKKKAKEEKEQKEKQEKEAREAKELKEKQDKKVKQETKTSSKDTQTKTTFRQRVEAYRAARAAQETNK